MKKVVDQLRTVTLVKTIFYILFGLIVVLKPKLVLESAIYILTGYLALIGIINIFQAVRSKQGDSVVNSEFIVGAMNLLMALIVLLFAKVIVSFLPVLLGIIIVLNGLLQFGSNSQIREVNPRFRMGTMIYGVFLVVAGLLVIFNPFKSVLIIFQIFGGILIFMGVAELVSYFLLRKNANITDLN